MNGRSRDIDVRGRRTIARPPGAWADDGTCSSHPLDLWNSPALHERREAAAICATCPVLDNCRTWAHSLPRGDRWGVIAATDWNDKRKPA